MRTISVFHVPPQMFPYVPGFYNDKLVAFVLGQFPYYRKVAEVECSDLEVGMLEEAYHRTNNIDEDKVWWENVGVKFLGSVDYGMDGCRSTSVGDVLLYIEDEKVHAYVVASFGFVELPLK